MQKNEFIEEVNRTIEGINLSDENLDYIYKDLSDHSPLSNNVIASITYEKADVTITYNGQTKTYKAGDRTTFPCDFVSDYNNGYYTK